MSHGQETIVALKSSFLRTQIRSLSQPLRPSERWHNSSGRGGTLTDDAINHATREVNRRLRRHTKAAYSSLAVRHVAEQIDRLYWDAAATDLEHGDYEEPDDGVLRVGDDLTSVEAIDKLPDTWEFDTDGTLTAKQRSDRDAYEEACRALKTLSESREAALRKLRAMEQLKTALLPFEDPRQNVQPNLVTRDGKLAEELDRCIELSVRVGARLGAAGSLEKWNDDTDMHVDQGKHGGDDAAVRLQKAWDAT